MILVSSLFAGKTADVWTVAQNTAIISTHITHGGATASNVCKLANLRVAYETHISALYIVFEKNEDCKFI